MLGRRPIDPLARQVSLIFGVDRIAIGLAALFATDPALRAVGFPQPNSTGRAVAKTLGARDLTLGALTLAARNDRAALRTVTFTAAALDAADAVAFGFAAADPRTRRAGLGSVAVASAAALVGFWASRRLA